MPRIPALALAVLALLGSAVTAAAQSPALVLQPGMLAVTGCVGGAPRTVLSPELDSLTAREVEAHEAVHRRQLAGNCEQRLREIKSDPRLELTAEAEATCEQLRFIGQTVEPGLSYAIRLIDRWLAWKFEAVSSKERREAIARYCRVSIYTLDLSP